MNWTEQAIFDTAKEVLTPLQFDAFRLSSAGVTPGRIARMYGISEPVARRRVERAFQKVQLALESKEAA